MLSSGICTAQPHVHVVAVKIPWDPLHSVTHARKLHSQVKLLAEPWDCGMYQVGTFPNWDVWGEWNGKFRDDFRSVRPAWPEFAALLCRMLAEADVNTA